MSDSIQQRLISRTWLLGSCLALLWWATSSSWQVNAADKSGVKPTVLSLPTGAGSVEGLGESFEPQLNTGTGTYSVKISIPPGRAGFAPALTLAYNSGVGNSEFGIGWALSVPRIARQIDKGLPSYSDQDVFIFEGEELARLSDNYWRSENEGAFERFVRQGNYWIGTERGGIRHTFGKDPVTSASQVRSRVLRGKVDSFDETYCWHLDSSTDLNGNTIRYFYSSFDDSPGRLYLSEVRYNESPGNSALAMRVVFEYSETAPGVARKEARSDLGEPDADLSLYRSWSAAQGFPTASDRVLTGLASQMTGYPIPKDWTEPAIQVTSAETRPDAISDFRPGFHVRTGRRCRSISVYEGLQLIRRYELDYETESPNPSQLVDGLSLLRRVTVFGKDGHPDQYLPSLTLDYTTLARPETAKVRNVNQTMRFPLSDPNTQLLDVNADGLPDIVHIEPSDAHYWLNLGLDSDGKLILGRERTIQNLTGGIRLADQGVQLADMDGNGASDLIYYRGPGEGNLSVFPSPRFSRGGYDTISAQFGQETFFIGPTPFPLGDPRVQFIDLNFDKLTDAMISDPFGFSYYINDRQQKWKDLGATDFGSAEMGNIPAGTSFDNPNVQLADMNGDRMQDLIRVQIDNSRIAVYYWYSRGNRRWDLGRVMLGNTFAFTDNPADLRIMDINGDGLSDLVALGPSAVNSRLRYWINKGTGVYGAPVTFDQTNSQLPEYSGNTVFRIADMDANGTLDLIYANDFRIDFVDFSGGGPKPHLLSTIDNGIGKRVSLAYKSSVTDMLDAWRHSQPWEQRPPFPVNVVSTITTEIGPQVDSGPTFDFNEDGKQDAYHSSLIYRDGAYDPYEKEFRGFQYADRVEWGDDYDWDTKSFIAGARVGNAKSVTLVQRFRFHLGLADGADNDEYPQGYSGPTKTDERTELGGAEEESLKGRVLWEEKVDGAALRATLPSEQLAGGSFAPDKFTYSRIFHDYKIRRLYRSDGDASPPAARFSGAVGLNGRGVNFPIEVATRTFEIEANGYLNQVLGHPLRAPAELLSEAEYDDYGNVTRATHWGLVTGGGVTLAQRQYADDEKISITRFIDTPDTRNRWIINCAYEQRIEDEGGAFVSMSQTHYDGVDFIGLPLQQLGSRALVTRVEQFVNGAPGEVPANNTDNPVSGGVLAAGIVGDARLAPLASIQASRMAFDAYGNAVAMLDPLGDPNDIATSVDGAGRPLFTSAAAGHLRSILYDPDFFTYPVRETIHLEAAKPPLSMQATYDTGLGVMTSSTDFNGNVTTYTYDAFGRLTRIIRPGAPGDSLAQPTERFEYRAADPWTGNQLLYDVAGSVTAVGGSPGRVANSVRSYLRENFTNAEPLATLDSVKYTDGLGRALLQLGEGETAAERADGRATGPVIGKAARYNLRQAPFADQLPYFGSNSAALLYEPPAAKSSSRVETYPDALGRPVRVLQPPENSGGGRYFSLTRNLPRETQSLDEEQTRRDSDHPIHEGAMMIHKKDGLGRLVEVREVVKIGDDGETLAAPVEWVTRYHYDLQDNLVHIRDSQNNEKWIRHDGLGRKLFMNDPDRGVLIYSYDNAGNLIDTLDAKAQEIQYFYDGANRLLAEDYQDAGTSVTLNRSPDVAYTYDGLPGSVDPGDGGPPRIPTNLKGMLAAVHDLTGAEYHSYDERGRNLWTVKSVADPRTGLEVPYALEMRYDAMDRLRDVIYPDGDAAQYAYNSRGEIESIKGGRTGEPDPNAKTIVANRDLIASGQEQLRRLGNGINSTREYDPRLRLNHLKHAGSQGPLVDYGYAFDAASNITRIDDLRTTTPAAPGYVDPASPRRNTQLFTYDDLYRLTSVDYPRAGTPGGSGGRIAYRYDRIGNMLSMRTPLPGQTGAFTLEEDGKSIVNMGAMTYGEAGAGQTGATGPAGRAGRASDGAAGPHALTNTASGRHYEYDANGNMRKIEDDAALWDFKDRLSALNNGKRRADYRYDYTDRRITKLVQPLRGDGSIDDGQAATVTVYIDKLFELREGDNPVKYVFLGEERLARVTGSLAPARERIQRLRYSTGWNLATPIVSPPGGSTARSIFGLGDLAAVTAIYRRDPSTGQYLLLASGSPVAPGEAYWIAASAPAYRAIRGSYTAIDATPPPPNILIPPGASLAAWPRFEPFPMASLPAAIQKLFAFNSSSQSHTRLVDRSSPGFLYGPPTFVASGAGFIVRSDSATRLITASIDQLTRAIVFILPDHLNSYSWGVDGDANLLEEHVYLPFGNIRYTHTVAQQAPTLTYSFAAKEADTEGQLTYFEARYDCPTIGRFISVDPISQDVDRNRQFSPQTQSGYTFCRNNPLVFVDPSGLDDYIVAYTTGNKEGDRDFEQAANTQAAEIRSRDSFDSSKDHVLLQGVQTKEDFATLLKSGTSVAELHLFSHSGEDGPIFHSGSEDENRNQYIDKPGRDELRAIKVDWAQGAVAKFYGCNSFVFAASFAKIQQISTWGYYGWSSFSGSPHIKIPSQPTGKTYMIRTDTARNRCLENSEFSNGGISRLCVLREKINIILNGADGNARPMRRFNSQGRPLPNP